MKAERILGALYGQALGDAMGMPSELWPRTRVKAHFGWIDRFLPGPKENNAACYFNRAEFTDDTAMALCLADALLECEGNIDPEIIGRNILAWAVSRAVNGDTWQSIADSLPAIAHQAQTARITTFSASLSARLELALNIVRHADGVESASEQLYQIIGAGTSTIESVPCAIAMVELANTDPNRCAVLCANLGGDTDTIGAMATAICGALHGVSAINPQLKQTLDKVNQLDFARYAVALASYRQRREAL